MRTDKPDKVEKSGYRPIESYELGMLLFGLFGIPLVIHLLASLST